MPVIGVRPLEGRVGSTLLMDLLASSPEVVCDRRYPVGEYRYLSYCARVARWMGTPFDPQRDVGVTEMLFADGDRGGPLPWEAESLSIDELAPRALRGLWDACSAGFRDRNRGAAWYAEKLACPAEVVDAAGIPIHVIDVVRDPRDMVASMISFGERSGPWGFGRSPGESDGEWLTRLTATLARRLDALTEPSPVSTLLLRYEDFAADLHGTARLLEADLCITLDPHAVLAQRPDHHVTTASVAASIGRWRIDLPSEVADMLWSSLAHRLEPLGYTRN